MGLLSHTRNVPRGESIELLTDDFLAPKDIPEWGASMGWTVTGEAIPDGYRFDVGRPGLSSRPLESKGAPPAPPSAGGTGRKRTTPPLTWRAGGTGAETRPRE